MKKVWVIFDTKTEKPKGKAYNSKSTGSAGLNAERSYSNRPLDFVLMEYELTLDNGARSI